MPELPRRQRIGAYAVVRRTGSAGEEILLTRVAPRVTQIAGSWTLPGGGVDHGEDPVEAVVREVWEETGLKVSLRGILDVTHGRRVIRQAGESLDYHSIQLIFEAELDPESRDVVPHVTEVDGSCDAARWWPLEQARGLPLLLAAAHVLGVRRIR